jgi:hypothetical protein
MTRQDAQAYQDNPSDDTVSKSLNFEIVAKGKGQVTAYSPNTTLSRSCLRQPKANLNPKKLESGNVLILLRSNIKEG